MKYTILVVFCLALVSQVLTIPAPPQTPPFFGGPGTGSGPFGNAFAMPQSFGGAPSQNGWPTPQLPQGVGTMFSQPGGSFPSGPRTTVQSQPTRNSPTTARIMSELTDLSEPNLAIIYNLIQMIKTMIPQSQVSVGPTQSSNGPVPAGPRSSSQWPEQFPPTNGGPIFSQAPRIQPSA